MLNLSLQNYPELEIDTREMDKGGDSYTINTLRALKDEAPKETFCLIIGMDSFNQFKSWKNWQDFSAFAHLIVLARPNYQYNNLAPASFEVIQDKQLLNKQQHGLLYFASGPLIDISSSEIRCKIAANKNLDDLLPKTLINYLKTAWLLSKK